MDMFGRVSVTAGAVMAIFLLSIAGLAAEVSAQAPASNFEEIVINFEVPRLVSRDIFVQYDGRTVYLPLIEVFSLLEFKVNHDSQARRIYGFIFSESTPYEIDLEYARITFQGKPFDLPRDAYLYDGHELYLRNDLFETFFALPTPFDFSKLQVIIPLSTDFPAFQRLKRRQAQEKLLAKKEEEKKVYPLPFRRAYFKAGVIDWMIAANPIGNRQTQYFNLNTGLMVLGGDMTVSGTGNTRAGFDRNDLRYTWHYYFSDSKYITQTELGNVFVGGRLSRSLDGALATNRPQVRRKLFQTIRLNDQIGPGWEVELYIDNRLTDFTRTDDRGTYDFNVDIFYGASLITLKMYGPNGEIKTEEIDVKIPYNLVPRGAFEYAATLGKDDNFFTAGFYGQTLAYYGITNRLTVGFGTDLPLATDSAEKKYIASGEIAYQPLTNLTVNAYGAPGHALNGGLNFSQLSFININGNLTHFLSDDYRNPAGRLQSISLSVSSPLKLLGYRLGLRANTFIDRFEDKTEINTYYGLSSTIRGIYFNYFGRSKVEINKSRRPSDNDFTSQLVLSTTLIQWLRPQIRLDYDHTKNRFLKYGLYLTKRVFKTGQLTFSYERNPVGNSDLAMVAFSLYTDFANFISRGLTSRRFDVQQGRDEYEFGFTQTQRGSIRFDQETGSLHFDRRAGVGQGSAVLRPFIDRNFNGVLDKGDEPVPGLTANIKGASGRLQGQDRIFYFDRLRAYDEYVVEINEYSLDDPLLKPVHEGYRLYFNPNMVTAIEVPIVVAGEASGLIRRQTIAGLAGLGGVKVVLINLATGERHEVITFTNGEFYLLGLIPGRYRAEIDRQQLENYGYRVEPSFIDFEIETRPEGGTAEDINFLLIPH